MIMILPTNNGIHNQESFPFVKIVFINRKPSAQCLYISRGQFYFVLWEKYNCELSFEDNLYLFI